MKLLFEQAEILGALELGILPLTGNIDKMLASLPADDAHHAKRKFRKIKRQLQRKHPARADRTMVRKRCREIGLKILAKN